MHTVYTVAAFMHPMYMSAVYIIIAELYTGIIIMLGLIMSLNDDVFLHSPRCVSVSGICRVVGW